MTTNLQDSRTVWAVHLRQARDVIEDVMRRFENQRLLLAGNPTEAAFKVFDSMRADEKSSICHNPEARLDVTVKAFHDMIDDDVIVYSPEWGCRLATDQTATTVPQEQENCAPTRRRERGEARAKKRARGDGKTLRRAAPQVAYNR